MRLGPKIAAVPSGGPGDNPVADILRWRRPVYSQSVDILIAELAELLNGIAVEDFLRDERILRMKRSDAELTRAEGVLVAKRDELYQSAAASGWDMDDMDERINAQRDAVAAAWKTNK